MHLACPRVHGLVSIEIAGVGPAPPVDVASVHERSFKLAIASSYEPWPPSIDDGRELIDAILLASPSVRARLDRSTSAALAVGAVCASWLLAWAGGSVGIARTDDWAYIIIARNLHHTGHVHLIGYGQMMLVGLAAWAQPFLWVLGDHRWVLQLASSCLFAVGIYGGHRLARVLLAPARATFVVLTIVAFPGVLRDASSFMTDGPALGLHVLVLLAGLGFFRAVDGRRTAWLVAIGLLGVFAFSVRELTIAAPLAVLMTIVWSSDRTMRRRSVVVLVVVLTMCAGLWAWRHSLPGGEPYAGSPTAVVAALKLVGSILAVGLGLSPVLALTWRRWWHPRHSAARLASAVIGVGIVLVPVVVQRVRHQHLWWLVGDYVQANGINGDKLVGGRRPIVLPRYWWDALVVVAVIATVVLIMLLLEWALEVFAWRRRGLVDSPVVARNGAPDESGSDGSAIDAPSIEALTVRMLLLHDVAYGASLLAAGLGNGNVFDRYLWPLLLSAAIVVAHRFTSELTAASVRDRWPPSATRVPAAATAVLVGLGVTALLLTANSDAFDGARWRAANEAVRRGALASDVDAGFEWIGTNQPNRHCIWIVSSPLATAGLHEIATSSWRPFLVGPTSQLHIYRADAPGCPPAVAAGG